MSNKLRWFKPRVQSFQVSYFSFKCCAKPDEDGFVFVKTLELLRFLSKNLQDCNEAEETSHVSKVLMTICSFSKM